MKQKHSKGAYKHPRAKFSFRRQVVPPLVGVLITVLVFGVLNGQWLTAQWRYKFAKPAAVVSASGNTDATAPSTAIDPSLAPEIDIPKIQVKAPVVFDEPSLTEWKVQVALRKGVVHYGDTAMPGENGNMVILGHSSGQLWAPGSYKFVFTLLDHLVPGDTFALNYKGTRYTYQVSEKLVVEPTNIKVLEPSGRPTLTLVTCTPVGSSKYRLIVRADQISPVPDPNQPPAKPSKLNSNVPIPN